MAGILRDDVWPAYAGYAEALRAYRPHARDSIGLCDVRCGEEAYASLIAQHTTVAVGARTVHELGERELALAKEEERAVAAGMGYAGAAEAIEAYTASGANTPATREELLELARDQVRRSWEAAPRFFGRLPATPCTVKAVEEFRERDMPPAFYYPPAGDGSRDGIYYVNLGDLPRRRLHAMAAISFHEANPGHHFQLTLEVEQTATRSAGSAEPRHPRPSSRDGASTPNGLRTRWASTRRPTSGSACWRRRGGVPCG